MGPNKILLATRPSAQWPIFKLFFHYSKLEFWHSLDDSVFPVYSFIIFCYFVVGKKKLFFISALIFVLFTYLSPPFFVFWLLFTRAILVIWFSHSFCLDFHFYFLLIFISSVFLLQFFAGLRISSFILHPM